MKNWHYYKNFGMHFDLHATEFDTELGKSITYETLKKTLEIIKPEYLDCDCKGHMGLMAWPTETGTRSKYYRDALKIHSDVCKDMGIPLVVHFTGLWDKQTMEDHPEWVAVGPDGKIMSNEGYHWAPIPFCPNSPFWEEVMIPQMLEVIEKYDIDGFWIDGDTWANKLCYCDKCKEEFIQKYGFEPPVFIKSNSSFNGFITRDDYSKNYNCSFEDWNKWIGYHRAKYLENAKKYVDAVHSKKPDCQVAINWLYAFGLTLPLSVDTDYVSGDELYCSKSTMLNGHFLPNLNVDWELMSWSMQNDGKFSNYEIKSLNQLKQDYAGIMACGGACLSCHQPSRSGLVADFVSETFEKLGEFVKARAPYVRHNKPIPQIAVLVSRDDINEKQGEMLIGPDISQPQLQKFYGLAELLRGNHLQYDILYDNNIARLEDYQIAIITGQERWTDEFKNKLAEYVKNGGNLIIEGIEISEVFKELLGTEVLGRFDYNDYVTPPWQKNIYIPVNNEIATSQCNYMKVKTNTAKTLKYFHDGVVENECKTNFPAITINDFGKGKVLGLYTNMFEQYNSSMFRRYRELFEYMVSQFDTDFILRDVKAPHYAHFVLREKDGKKLISCMNCGSVAENNTKQTFCEDLPEISEVSFKVKTEKPKDVCLVPDNSRLSYFYEDGFLNVTIRDLDYLDILIIS